MKIENWPSVLFLGLVCGAFLVQQSAFAQDDYFSEQERETVKNVYQSPLNSRGEYSWLSDFMNTPWEGQDEVKPGEDSGELDREGSPEEQASEPEERERLGIMYGPMEGFADTMKAPVYKNMAKNLLTSPIAIFNTTLLLTEPGVGTGLNNAILESNGWLEHRYLAEQQLATQMQFYSEFGNATMQSYYHCLSKYNKENSDGGGGATSSGGVTKAGWIKAHDHCFLDKDATLGNESDNKNDFEEPDTEMFQLVSMLGGDEGEGSDPADPFSGEDKVLLTEILFGKANSGDPTTAGDVTGAGDDGKDKLREAFQQIIGDVEYTKESGDADGSGGSAGGGSSAFGIKWKIRFPGVGEGAIGIKHSEQLKKIEKEMFDNIILLLRKKCTFLTNTDNIKPFQKPKFWKGDESGSRSDTETPTDEELMNVSVYGFQFPPPLGDILYSLFTVKQFSSLGEGEEREQVCNDIFGAEATSSGDKTLYDELSADPTKAGREHKAVLSLARRLAYLRWLGVLSQALKAVLGSTGGATGLPVIRHAVHLIQRAAGTEDLQGKRLQVLAELTDVVQKLAAYQQSIAGSMGEGLSKAGKDE